MSAILIGVVFTFNTPINEAQAVHQQLTICVATNPHLAMKPTTTIQPDPLFTGINNPPDLVVTWIFNKAIADSLAAHGLGFLTLTGPNLSIQPTSFGPVTNSDHTVEINFDGATVAAALEQHLNNLNVNEADVTLFLSANYGAQPHLLDDSNETGGIICATSANGNDTIRVIRIIDVDIDIKPGSDPNSINTKSKGVIPVAILGSDTFDVTDIDVTTLAFGPSGASPSHDPAGHLEDVNDDGFTDLVTHYKQKETGLASGDTDACITGATTAGIPIDGCDSVKVK